MTHCPAFYVKCYRKFLILLAAMYIIALVGCHFDYEDKTESVYMMIQMFFASWMIYGMFEAVSWIYRISFMTGSFRDYRVIMKMVLSREDDFNDIGMNMSVWPATKAYNVYSKWGKDIRSFWVFTMIATSSILCISIGMV